MLLILPVQACATDDPPQHNVLGFGLKWTDFGEDQSKLNHPKFLAQLA